MSKKVSEPHGIMRRLALWLTTMSLTMLLPGASVSAHGGEDHAEQPAPAVASAGAGTVTRVARAGDYELTLKHAPIVPDRETSARVFVTRFETNEPVERARITIIILRGDGGSQVPQELTATATATPGIYEARLPPLPRGEYQLAARLEVNGAQAAAEYGAIQVAPLPPPAIADESSTARTALIALGLLLGLGAAGAVVYRAVQSARRERIKGKPVTA